MVQRYLIGSKYQRNRLVDKLMNNLIGEEK